MKRTLLSLLAILALGFTASAQLFIEEYSGLADSRGITDLYAVDGNVVWGAAYDGTTPTNPCNDFCRTINGGTLWTGSSVTGATGLSIANIVAIDGFSAWACCYNPGSGSNHGGIFYTSDGGTTWTKQATALFTNSASFPDCVHFFDESNGWAMGDPISGEFEIYTTSDGGNQWTAVPGSQIPNPVSGEFGVVGYYSAIGNTIWFGTNKGRVYKSTDQGHNWTVSTVLNWSAIYVQPFFKSATVGFVMDKSSGATVGNLAKTTDGGTTWTAITPTGNHFSNDMSFVPGTASTWITTGADVTNNLAGVTYSFDDCATFGDMTETIGSQYLSTAWVNDSTGWVGAFVASGAGGMWKFNSILAPPVSNFMAEDTAIVLGGSVHYTNLSTGGISTYLWTFQGGTPASSTLKTPPPVVYNAPGTYNVTLKVTGDFGTNTLLKTGYIYVGGVGISEQVAASISVYPNPVRDYVTVGSTYNIQEVQVVNLLGQVVKNQTVNGQKVVLNTSDLQSGAYNLKIKVENSFVYKKIIVN
jgi:PKD repeat protein